MAKSMTAARRWFLFGVPAALVAFALMSLWLGYAVPWKQEREEAIEKVIAAGGRVQGDGFQCGPALPPGIRPGGSCLGARAPLALQLLGVDACKSIYVPAGTHSQDKIRRLRALFPEAYVETVRWPRVGRGRWSDGVGS